MKKWLRRIRGAIGLGLTWAAAWSGFIVVAGLLQWTIGYGAERAVPFLVGMIPRFASMGFIGGAIFSTVLSLAEGRRRFDQMSLPRFAAWGALGGGLITSSVFFGAFGLGIDATIGVVVGALLGAGSASGSLALARRADERDLLEAGEDVADIGLTEEETRQLLGK